VGYSKFSIIVFSISILKSCHGVLLFVMMSSHNFLNMNYSKYVLICQYYGIRLLNCIVGRREGCDECWFSFYRSPYQL